MTISEWVNKYSALQCKAFWMLLFYIIILFAYFSILPQICKGQLSEEDSIYKVALGSYRDGFLDMAIEQFQAFIRLYPESTKTPYALFRLGDCFIQKKNYEEAEGYYSKNVQLPPHHVLYKPSLYRLAECFLFQKKFSSAILYFEKFMASYPHDELSGDALFHLAESLYQVKEYQKALDNYETLLQHYKNHHKSADSIYGAGWCLIKLKNYPKAIVYFEDLIKRYPDSSLTTNAYKKIADIYYQLENYQDAEKYYTRYLATHPKDLNAMGHAILNQGITLSFLNRHKDAITLYDTFLKNYKEHALSADIFFQRALYLYKTEQLYKAQEAFSEIKTTYKKNKLLEEKKIAASLYYLGLIEEKIGEPERALAEYTLLIKEYPLLQERFIYDALLRLGSFSYNDNNFSTAAEFYQKASKSEDSSIAAEATYYLADCFLAQQQKETGIALLEKFHDLFPNEHAWGQMASFRLGNIYEENKQWALALKEYKKASQETAYKGLSELSDKALLRIESKITHE
ncbi:MAG: tetratricopeptide repeat protein [bacterium]